MASLLKKGVLQLGSELLSETIQYIITVKVCETVNSCLQLLNSIRILIALQHVISE